MKAAHSQIFCHRHIGKDFSSLRDDRNPYLAGPVGVHPLDWLAVGELALSLHSFLGAWLAATTGHQFAVPFILLYAFGFGYVSLQGLWDGRRELRQWFKARSHRAARRTEAGRRKPLSAGQ